MKTILLFVAIVASVLLHGGYINTKLLYSNEFNRSSDLKGWQESPNKQFRPQAGVNGSGSLYFHARGYETDLLWFSLDPKTFRGKAIQLEAVVKARNLTRGKLSYYGPKVMLHYTAGKTEKYRESYRQYGTYDWSKRGIMTRIPENCDKLELFLGIQKAAGELWVDSVKIHECEESDQELPPPTEPNLAAMAIPRGNNRGAQYRGVMSGYDLSPAAFETLAAWKVNLIRYQMKSPKGQDVSTRETYLSWIDSEIEKIAGVLALAEKHGIKVIIDLHRGPGCLVTKVNSNVLKTTDFDLFAETWRRIANRFKGNQNLYAYDLLNEPVNNSVKAGEKGWQQLAEHLVKVIRAIDPDTPIIVEPFAGIDDFTGLNPINAKNIIYSPHFYQPFAYTHQGIFEPGGRWTYPGYINGIWWDKEQLRVTMKSAIEFQRKYNVPIFVGEFSSAVWSKGAERYLADTIELLEEYGWDWTYHAFREATCWNVELEPSEDLAPWKTHPAKNTPRKQVLLKALSKNR